MKKFINKIAFFTLPLFFIFTTPGYFLQFGEKSLMEVEGFNSCFRKYDADILLFGNSRILEGVNAKEFTNCSSMKTYNLGITAGNMKMSKEILEFYVKHTRIMPKAIILEVSGFTLSSQRTHYFPEIIDNFRGFYQVNRTRQGLINLLINLNENKNTNLKSCDTLIKGKKFYEKFPNGIASVDSNLLTCVKRFRDICKIKGIELVLFTSPESVVFKTKLINANDVLNLIIQDNDIYFDCRDLFHADLIDSHHLNRKSNIAFTTYLCEKIKPLLLHHRLVNNI
jgi:hypothetical protein